MESNDVKPETTREQRRRDPSHRVPDFIEGWSRGRFAVTAVLMVAVVAGLTVVHWGFSFLFIPVVAFTVVGAYDSLQTHHTVLRNFPVLGHLRYVAESIRPELRQYFVESDQEENPISREKRSIVYRRAKNALSTHPFGTLRPIYGQGYEWMGHSLVPTRVREETRRICIGKEQCERPYSASRLNVSAMSFGSLSANAVRALNEGAARGDFYHNTGEGGISRAHLEPKGDLVWQIGTAYFGCRTPAGQFDRELFGERARLDNVKMIEVKLSQGAKPSHGGILPAEKVSAEIAQTRGVPEGQTVVSPPAHSAFEGPAGLLDFISELRALSGGKPVGFKLCVGHPVEFMAIVKAMVETERWPDFITVDGAEGGTGAAPLEFSNSVGMPLEDGLTFVNNSLLGAGMRERIRVVSAGRITTGFHVVRQLALGADLCNAARAMMFALGCIQALKCNTNRCPTGITTQDPRLTGGLVVEHKARRVERYHAKTMDSLLELVGAAGLSSPDELRPHHVFRRISHNKIETLSDVHPLVPVGSLLHGEGPDPYQALWNEADPRSFAPKRGGSASFA